MKKLILPVIATVFFAACGSEAGSEHESANTETKETNMADANVEKDPVCGMAKDETWTDYSVNNADTVWFCSHVCKGAYESHPEKYNKG